MLYSEDKLSYSSAVSVVLSFVFPNISSNSSLILNVPILSIYIFTSPHSILNILGLFKLYGKFCKLHYKFTIRIRPSSLQDMLFQSSSEFIVCSVMSPAIHSDSSTTLITPNLFMHIIFSPQNPPTILSIIYILTHLFKYYVG